MGGVASGRVCPTACATGLFFFTPPYFCIEFGPSLFGLTWLRTAQHRRYSRLRPDPCHPVAAVSVECQVLSVVRECGVWWGSVECGMWRGSVECGEGVGSEVRERGVWNVERECWLSNVECVVCDASDQDVRDVKVPPPLRLLPWVADQAHFPAGSPPSNTPFPPSSSP